MRVARPLQIIISVGSGIAQCNIICIAYKPSVKHYTDMNNFLSYPDNYKIVHLMDYFRRIIVLSKPGVSNLFARRAHI